jgi:hypothetical protein
MHISTRLVSFSLAALVLGTSMASAGVWDTIIDKPYSPPVTINVTPKINYNEGVADAIDDKLNPKLPYIKLIDIPGEAGAIGEGVLALECQVADAGDLLLINSGTVDLPAGAKVKWEVRSADLKGFVTFKAGFAAGANFTLSDALDGLDAAAPCAAKPIGL